MKYSFIIPTFNRIEQLKNCLQSIQNQRTNIEFEIIVVNDGGVDFELDSKEIIVINQNNSGPACARNLGAENSKGKYLIFVDDDCILTSDWLSEIDLVTTENAIITGKTMNACNSIFSQASQDLVSYLFEAWKDSTWHFFTSNNLVINKINFIELGKFNTNFPLAAGEDREFCLRAKLKQYQFIYQETALVYHYHFLSINNFFKQHLNYGKGAFFFNKEIQKFSLNLPLQSQKFYFKMLIFPFEKHPFFKALSISTLIIFSQLFNIIGFIIQANKNNE